MDVLCKILDPYDPKKLNLFQSNRDHILFSPKIWSLESEIFEAVKKKVETRLSSQTSMMGLFRKNSERLLAVN